MVQHRRNFTSSNSYRASSSSTDINILLLPKHPVYQEHVPVTSSHERNAWRRNKPRGVRKRQDGPSRGNNEIRSVCHPDRNETGKGGGSE